MSFYIFTLPEYSYIFTSITNINDIIEDQLIEIYKILITSKPVFVFIGTTDIIVINDENILIESLHNLLTTNVPDHYDFIEFHNSSDYDYDIKIHIKVDSNVLTHIIHKSLTLTSGNVVIHSLILNNNDN